MTRSGILDGPTPRFAIVCDSACDLPFATIEAAGVALVPLVVRNAGKEYQDAIDLEAVDFFVQFSSIKGQVDSFAPSEDVFVQTYRRLADEGWRDIVSLHASSLARDAYDIALHAARQVKDASVHVLDSKCVSGQLALVLVRLVCDRDAGLDAASACARAGEAATAARALIIPAPDASPKLQGYTRARAGILTRADSLRARALGVRRVFCIDQEGAAQELFRSTDLSRLAGNMARTMSHYAHKVGALTYVEINAGVPRLLSTIEKPLDTNEFESRRVAILNTNPATTSQLGVGAVGVAYVPSSIVSAEEADRILNPGV